MAAGISPATNRLVNIIVSVGAAVVIFGAWAKILHKSFADIMLTVGLLTEAAIFIVYAILPPPDAGHAPEPAKSKSSGSAMDALDQMMEKAGLSEEKFAKLSEGFDKLNTTVAQIGTITDAVNATNEYASKAKEAAGAIGTMKEAYLTTASSLSEFNEASESAKGFHSQVQLLTKNLSSLNTIYELELQESNAHLKSLNQFYGKLAEASNAMQNSTEDAKRVKDQIAALADNLTKLNHVYGNMISAMQGR